MNNVENDCPGVSFAFFVKKPEIDGMEHYRKSLEASIKNGL